MTKTIKVRFVGGLLHNRLMETEVCSMIGTCAGMYYLVWMKTLYGQNPTSFFDPALFFEYVHESLMVDGYPLPCVIQGSCAAMPREVEDKLYAHYLKGLSKVVDIKRIMEFVGDTVVSDDSNKG